MHGGSWWPMVSALRMTAAARGERPESSSGSGSSDFSFPPETVFFLSPSSFSQMCSIEGMFALGPRLSFQYNLFRLSLQEQDLSRGRFLKTVQCTPKPQGCSPRCCLPWGGGEREMTWMSKRDDC